MEQASLQTSKAEKWAKEAFDQLSQVEIDEQVTAVRCLIEKMHSARLASLEEARKIKKKREQEFYEIQEGLGMGESSQMLMKQGY